MSQESCHRSSGENCQHALPRNLKTQGGADKFLVFYEARTCLISRGRLGVGLQADSILQPRPMSLITYDIFLVASYIESD